MTEFTRPEALTDLELEDATDIYIRELSRCKDPEELAEYIFALLHDEWERSRIDNYASRFATRMATKSWALSELFQDYDKSKERSK